MKIVIFGFTAKIEVKDLTKLRETQ